MDAAVGVSLLDINVHGHLRISQLYSWNNFWCLPHLKSLLLLVRETEDFLSNQLRLELLGIETRQAHTRLTWHKMLAASVTSSASCSLLLWPPTPESTKGMEADREGLEVRRQG